jgi:hypothetical protein
MAKALGVGGIFFLSPDPPGDLTSAFDFAQ